MAELTAPKRTRPLPLDPKRIQESQDYLRRLLQEEYELRNGLSTRQAIEQSRRLWQEL